MGRDPVLVHVTTVDMSLTLLLLPQLVAFRDAGYDVVGVSAPGPHVTTLREHGIRHIALRHSTRANDLWADLRTARDFARICRRLQPDIVHTHNPKPGIYGRIGARLAGVPVVVNTVHGLYAQPDDPLPRRTAVYALERLAASFSDAELLQNPEDLPVFERLRVPRHKLHVLGNGVDLTRFDPTGPDQTGSGWPGAEPTAAAQTGTEPTDAVPTRDAVRRELGFDDHHIVVGLVGRLVREKGYREVFEAARTLAADRPDLRFVVVGPTDLDKDDAITPTELEAAAADGNVRFLGMRDDVHRLYLAMDLYVLASHREGFPRSAMEAAAMGLPIVATDIRGCRQVVDHEVTGSLVPVRDPAALAAAIGTLVDDPARRRTMAAASRAKALAEFDDRHQVEITLGVYERLLGGAEVDPGRRGGGRPPAAR